MKTSMVSCWNYEKKKEKKIFLLHFCYGEEHSELCHDMNEQKPNEPMINMVGLKLEHLKTFNLDNRVGRIGNHDQALCYYLDLSVKLIFLCFAIRCTVCLKRICKSIEVEKRTFNLIIVTQYPGKNCKPKDPQCL